MPYFLFAIGVVAGYLDYLGFGNVKAAGTMLSAELFTHNPPFYKWLGAIMLVGLIGYIPAARPVAVGMLILILLAILLEHNNALVNALKVT